MEIQRYRFRYRDTEIQGILAIFEIVGTNWNNGKMVQSKFFSLIFFISTLEKPLVFHRFAKISTDFLRCIFQKLDLSMGRLESRAAVGPFSTVGRSLSPQRVFSSLSDTTATPPPHFPQAVASKQLKSHCVCAGSRVRVIF